MIPSGFSGVLSGRIANRCPRLDETLDVVGMPLDPFDTGTYEKLVEALPDDVYMGDVPVGCVYMGMVQYKDYSSFEDWIPGDNVMYPFIHKRREFEYEKEVRALTWTPEGFSKQRREKGGYKPHCINLPGIWFPRFISSLRGRAASSSCSSGPEFSFSGRSDKGKNDPV